MISRGSQLMKIHSVGKERCALSMLPFGGRGCAPSTNLEAQREQQCGLIWRGSPSTAMLESHGGHDTLPQPARRPHTKKGPVMIF